MNPGQASKTAALVCLARAMAHGGMHGVAFDDPTASRFLPAESRALVTKFHEEAKSGKKSFSHAFLEARARMMLVRTRAIDDAVKGARAPQVVILGAGFDGRAWRMPELADAVVFEVDHPDTQKTKREHLSDMKRTAREVRFCAVDFTRDDLATALADAGHDPSIPTAWIWEGVVMYLTPDEVERTLRVIEARSAPASRLAILYHRRAMLTWLIAPYLRWIGEPLRSSYTAGEMRSLLATHGFDIGRDEDLPGFAGDFSPELARALRAMRHLRLVVADRR